jgi:hypothetical protein
MAPGKSRRFCLSHEKLSGSGHYIRYCEKNDDRERAEQKHVTHVVTRDARARFGRAFNDPIVLPARHCHLST